MATAEEIIKHNKEMSKALSSSSRVPYGLEMDPRPSIPMKQPEYTPSEPLVLKGPDPDKSSSTAVEKPEEKKMPSSPKPLKSAPKVRGGARVGNGDGQAVPSPGILVPYTAPKNEYTYERVSPDTMNWNDVPFGEETAELPKERHRSILQAIMGWDDIPYGQKWHHYLQHGVMAPGARSASEIRQNAALEANPTAAMSRTFGQELRAKEQKRRTLTSEWDKLLADWNKGVYASGDEATVRAFYEEAERLRNAMAQEGINPYTLRMPSINAGGFAQGFQKSISQDREKLDWLGGWLDSIQQNVSENPRWLESNAAQMEFDKLSEYVILNWAQSKGAIADAEKVRAQVEAMPREDRVVFDKFMKMFFGVNQLAQVEALANYGDRNAMAVMESFYKFMDMADKGKLGVVDKYGNIDVTPAANEALTGALFGYQQLWKNSMKGDNNPIDINSAITSFKNAREAFLQYTMQNANVDRQAIWDMARDQFNVYKNNYTRKLPQLGLLSGWDYRGPSPDENFGNYLANWQSAQRPNNVMASAGLGWPHPPKPVNSPAGGAGGRGGLAQQKRKGGYVKVNGRWVKQQ